MTFRIGWRNVAFIAALIVVQLVAHSAWWWVMGGAILGEILRPFGDD